MLLPELENVLRTNLNAPSNEIRAQAERRLTELKRSNPMMYYTGLAEVAAKSSDATLRALASVIFRRNILITDDTFDNVPAQARQAVQNNFLQAILHESDRSVRTKLGDTVGAIACRVLPRGPWAEFQPALMTLSQSPDPQGREAFLVVLVQVAEFAPEILQERMADVRETIKRSLCDDFPPVRCVAMKACVAILRAVDDVDDLGAFRDMIPIIFECISAGGTDMVIGSHCEQLQMLLESRVALFETHFVPIMRCLIGIVNEGSLSWPTRRQAMNLIVTFIELSSKYEPVQVAREVVPLGFAFLDQFDSSIEWNSPADDHDQDNFEFGAQCLVRLAENLGEEVFLSVAQPILERNFSSPDWKPRLVGLGAVKNVVDICADSWRSNLNDVVQVAGASLGSDHPYVRYMALSVLLQLCVVYGEDGEFHQEFHQPIMQAIVTMIKNERHRCVLSQTCELATHFCYSCPDELLSQYAEGLLESVHALLGRNDPLVQSSACKTVSVIAACMEEQFVKFYQTFMQTGKTLLQIPVSATSSGELFHMRGKAMEMIGAIVASCPAMSKQDGHQIMQILLPQTANEKQMGLISYNYMMRLFTAISTALGSEFCQYLDHIIPGLIESSKLQPTGQFDVDDPNAPADAQHIISTTVRVSVLGEKKICVNTDAIQEKECAVEQLARYAEVMEGDFFPYVEPVFVAVKECCSQEVYSRIRTYAIDAMSALVHCYVDGVNKQGGNGQQQSQEMCLAVIPLLIDSIALEQEVDGVNNVLSTLTEIFEEAAPRLSEDLVGDLVEQVATGLTERQFRNHRGDAESEAYELDSVSEDMERAFADTVTDFVGMLAKLGQEVFVRHFENTVSKICVELLDKNGPVEDIILGLGIFTEVVDKAGPSAVKYGPDLLNVCQQCLGHSDAGLLQQASYTVGVCAKSKIMVNTDGFLNALKQVVDNPASRSEENIGARENSISAIGKICRYHADKFDVSSVFPAWLQMLPIENDDEEREFCNDYLFEQLEGAFKDVVVSNEEVMTQILKIFGNAIVNEDSHTAKFGQAFNFMLQTNKAMVQKCLGSGKLDEKTVAALTGMGTCA